MRKPILYFFITVLAIASQLTHAQVSRLVPVNGIVRASVLNTTTGVLYIGGDFTTVNAYETGLAALLSSFTGLPKLGWPVSNGAVYTCIPDGAGGWYIGGSFSQVGGENRNNIAHINAAKSVSGWNPNANSEVKSLALSGSTVYVGGDFTTIAGVSRNRLAALDATAGSATSWNPSSNQIVRTLALSGNTIYALGDFSTIGGQSRNYMAAVDASTGTATSWNPNANNPVRTFAINGSIVYVGGEFTNIGGQSRNYMAALDANTGIATNWNPNANKKVWSIALSVSKVYVAGDFENIGGNYRYNIAALDANTGTATDWRPYVNAWVHTLALRGNTVYAGGNFDKIGFQLRIGIAALDATTGETTSWNPNGYSSWNEDADFGVRTFAFSGNTVYAGGKFNNIVGGTGGWLGYGAAHIARLQGHIKAPQSINGLSSIINVTYGAANQTHTGVASSGLPISYSSASTSVASVTGNVLVFVNAGTTTITASCLENSDYLAANDVKIAVTVFPKSATISGTNATKVYGDANPSFTGTILGLVNGDNVNYSGLSTASKNSTIGSYPITATATGIGLKNYSFVAQNKFLTVTPKSATISGTNASKVFGDENPNFTGTIVGLVNGDNINYNGLTTASKNSGVGSYPITATATGAGLANYSFVAQNNLLKVTPKSATISGTNASKVYGDENPNFTGTIVGLVNGDNIAYSGITTANASTGVGSYPITATATGVGMENYSFVSQNSSLIIQPAKLTVMANDIIQKQGEVLPSVVYSILGFKNNDTESVLTSPIQTQIVGNVVSVFGANAENYTFEYINGTYTLTTNITNAVSENLSLKVYPNPNDGIFQIESPNVGTLSIYNSLGLEMYRTQVKTGIQTIETNLSVGVYSIKLNGKYGKIVVR